MHGDKRCQKYCDHLRCRYAAAAAAAAHQCDSAAAGNATCWQCVGAADQPFDSAAAIEVVIRAVDWTSGRLYGLVGRVVGVFSRSGSIASGGKTLASKRCVAAAAERPLGDRLGFGVAVVAVSKPRSQLLDLCALWWSIQRLRGLSAQVSVWRTETRGLWSAQEIVAYIQRLGALGCCRVI